jgi:hypothetical protein
MLPDSCIVDELTPEPPRLSDALERGATYRPQGFGKLFPFDVKAGTYASCAIAAVYEGAFGHATDLFHLPTPNDVSEKLTGAYEALDSESLVVCPGCNLKSNLWDTITHLNDAPNHRWSRENIAAWLRSKGW